MDQRQSPEVEELILKNCGLVYHIAKKYLAICNDIEELASIGTIGLIKAAQTFNKSNGILFSTYSGMCINNEIRMFLKKEKKRENDISLDESLDEYKDGNSITLQKIIPISNKDFTEEIAEREIFIRFINIVLNLLNSKERLVMLYRIADINQAFIANNLNLSQSYISRLEKQSIKKLKSYLTNYEPFKEVFSMSIQNDLYKISFSSKDVKNFCKIFSTLLQKFQPDSNLPDFKVNCNGERIIILLPADLHSFAFVAEIIQEIDNFNMTYTSNQSVSILPNNENANKQDSPKVLPTESIEENNLPIEDDDSNMTIDEISSAEGINNSSIDDNNSNMAVDNNESVIDVNLENNIEKEKDEFNLQEKVSSTEVRNYFMKLNTFTSKELKEKFPNSVPAIQNAISRAKQIGLIEPISMGKYSVIRNTEIKNT